MRAQPVKVFNIDIAYPTDLAAGIALVWVGCHYSAWMPALLPFGLGLLIILAAVLTPNVQAYMQWLADRDAEKLPDPPPVPVGGDDD